MTSQTADRAGKSAAAAPRTAWGRVALATIGGCACAFQVGKVSAALPALTAEFGLSVMAAGVLVGIFSLLAAVGGLAAGLRARRLGDRRAAILGLVLVGAASAAGAAAPGPALLLAARIAEGVGYVVAIVALAALSGASATPRDRPAALAIWAGWLPGGVAAALVLGALFLDATGWRGFWLVAAAAPLLAAVAIARTFPANPIAETPSRLSPEDWRALLTWNALALAVSFTLYSGQFLAVFAFLPTLLVEKAGVALSAAAYWVAGGALLNLVGNLAAGAALRAGADRRAVMITPLVLMIPCLLAIFADGASPALRIAGLVLYGIISGAVPSALWASVAATTSDPSKAPVVSGLLFQGAGAGQFLGPIVFSASVGAAQDWSVGWVAPVLASVAGIALALSLKTGR